MLRCIIVLSFMAAFVNGKVVEHPDDLKNQYDFIIVGGGAAGCRLAEKLSAVDKYDVLVIEAGDIPPSYTDIPLLTRLSYQGGLAWFWNLEPNNRAFFDNPNQTMVTGKVLGGGSTINLMNYERGSFEDYDTWANEYGATGWNGSEVFRYFKADENNHDKHLADGDHGRNGSMQVTSSYDTDILYALFGALEQYGFPIRDTGNGRTNGGYRMQATVGPDGKRSSSFNAFLKVPLYARPNLDVAVRSLAARVFFKPGQNSQFLADGVTMEINNRLVNVTAKREVILSAGAIQSPHLLLLSGVGPKEQLKQFNIPSIVDLPVGENLQNHLTVSGLNGVFTDATYLQVPSTKDINGLNQWFINGTGPFTSPAGTHLGAAFVNYNKSSPTSSIEIMLQGTADDQDCESRANTESQITFLPILMHPKSRGTIKLNSTDYKKQPKIDFNYFDHPDDLKDLALGTQLTNNIRSSSAFNATGMRLSSPGYSYCKQYQFDSLDFWKCFVARYAGQMAHPVGAVRMGDAKRNDTVVDPRLRVKGIPNLRVADSSIFPTLVTGHTCSPAIMVGAKAGDMILQDNA